MYAGLHQPFEGFIVTPVIDSDSFIFSVVTLLTTTTQLINLNKSSTAHFTKVSLHDLHMKLAFYGGTKEHRRNGAQ